MTRMESLKLRAGRALTVIAKNGSDDDWEKVVERLEAEASKLVLTPPADGSTSAACQPTPTQPSTTF